MKSMEIVPPKSSPSPSSTTSQRARFKLGGLQAPSFRRPTVFPPRPRANSPAGGGFNPASMLTGVFSGAMANAKTEIADRVRNFAINRGKDAGRKKEESEKKLVVLIIYSLFLLAYSITAMQGRETGALDPYTIYDMQLRLKKSITGTSGTPGNTSLYEVETVKDMYSYFRTTFHNAIYTATTFDGDPRFVGGGREGFLSGQMMLLGGVRISQGRSAKYDCMTKAPVGLFEELYTTSAKLNNTKASDENGTAVDVVVDEDRDGVYFIKGESHIICYNPEPETTNNSYARNTRMCDDKFNWESPPLECNGEVWGAYDFDPDTEDYSAVLSNLGYTIPQPGYSVTLPNRNGTLASWYYATLYHSKFIDLQTRFVYVDLAFWNFNVERLITLRLTFDMPLSGGVYPKVAVRVADLYTCSIARWSSAFDAAKTCSTSHQVRFVFEGLCLMAIVLVAIMAILQIFGAMFYILVLHYGLIEDERTSIAQCFQACLCSLKRSNNGERATTLYDRPDSLSEVNADDGGSFSGRKSKKKDNSTLWKHAKHVFTNYAREWWFWQFYLLLQLFVYFTYLLVRVITMELVPLGVDVGTDSYINFQTPALWADYSDRVNSFFIFLSWVRLFEFFNFFSGRNLGLFVLMAGVFILGSALANLIALGYYVKEYSTFRKAFFTTLSALRGDLPYDDISNIMQSGIAGTMFGFMYAVIFAYILFHLVLALLYAAGNYMNNLYGGDKLMKLLGVGGDDDDDNDDDDEDSEGEGRSSVMKAFNKSPFKPMMDQMVGSGKKGEKGGTMTGKALGVIESMMKLGGYGTRKRAVSETGKRRSSTEGLEDEASGDYPHHPSIIRQHSDIIMSKVKLFTEMSAVVGGIFGTNQSKVDAIIHDLLINADETSGQLPLGALLKAFSSMGMSVGPSTQMTLHSLFGQEKDLGDLFEVDDQGHTCLTAFGLNVSVPHVKVESLSLVMLAALPLMSGEKSIRDIMPELMKLDIVGGLATDLVQHVAKTMNMHYESINGEGGHALFLPESVVDGMDLIFNMISAAMEEMGIDENWRESCQGLIMSLKEGVHSLNDLKKDDSAVREFDQHSIALQKIMSDKRSTVVDVMHQQSKFKKRLSIATGHSLGVINEHLEGETSPKGKGSKFGWGKLKTSLQGGQHGPQHEFEGYAFDQHMRKDEDVGTVGDFLSNIMDAHGGSDKSLDLNDCDFYDVEDGLG